MPILTVIDEDDNSAELLEIEISERQAVALSENNMIELCSECFNLHVRVDILLKYEGVARLLKILTAQERRKNVYPFFTVVPGGKH